jgi:hypothetical protein
MATPLAACATAQIPQAAMAAPGVTSPDPVLQLLSGLNQPDDLLFAQGQLYVGEYGSGKIAVLGPELSETVLPVTVPEVEGMALLNGTLYVADQQSDSVVRVDGSQLTKVLQLMPVPGQEGVDGIGSAGNELIVPDSPRGRVLLVGPDGTLIQTFTGFVRPTGAWGLTGGGFLVADEDAGSVLAVAADGARTTIATGVPLADDVTEDSAGRIDVISIQDGTLLQVAPGSRVVLASGLDQPQGLTLDAADNSVVTQYGSGRLDEVVTTFQPLPGATGVSLKRDQPLCISVVRAGRFTAPVQIAAATGFRVVRQPGQGSVGAILPRSCPHGCELNLRLRSGALQARTSVQYRTAS